MLGLFIDGLLVGEVMDIPSAPTWEHMLPPRFTECTCDPDDEILTQQAVAEFVTYHVIMHGIQGRAAVLSVHNDEVAILDSLHSWFVSEFSAERWVRNCRSHRAFT